MAEIAALILVTCFPVMPLFIQLLTGKRSTHGKSTGYRSYELSKTAYTNASDRTALTDPEQGGGKGVVAGNITTAWSGRAHKNRLGGGGTANPNFREMLDGDAFEHNKDGFGLSNTSDDSIAVIGGGKSAAARPLHGFDGLGGDGKIKRTVSVDLSTQVFIPLSSFLYFSENPEMSKRAKLMVM